MLLKMLSLEGANISKRPIDVDSTIRENLPLAEVLVVCCVINVRIHCNFFFFFLSMLLFQ